MSIVEIGIVVIIALWFYIFVYPRMKSEYYLHQTFNRDTEEYVVNFIKGIKERNLEDEDYLLYLYGLKKEGKVKKLVAMEDSGICLIIRGYLNKDEYIDFWAFTKEENNLALTTLTKDEEPILKEEIESVANKYKDYDAQDVMDNIIFLVDNKENIK